MARRGKRVVLRVPDVARQLGLSNARVYALVANGTVPSVRIGGRIAIPVPAWDAWLAARRDEALAAVHDSRADR